jgi:hypothetical protein
MSMYKHSATAIMRSKKQKLAKNDKKGVKLDSHYHSNRNILGFKIFEDLDFETITKIVNNFADHIEKHFEDIADILLEYESFEVVRDETDRTLDLLRNLKENEEFFSIRIGAITSFLPRNQPLYALTCFVIIPSLMATEVHFRIPYSMRFFFPRLLRILALNSFFPNVQVSKKERLQFLKERSALKVNPETEESVPVTDAVIFTGTSHHAERLRVVFDQRTLFIANGSGHNPVIVAEDADIHKAVEATLTLQLYNQGQDCAAPNTILVHKHCYKPFMRVLRDGLRQIHVGNYRDRMCRVGPISEPEDLVRIQGLLVENRQWLDESTPGIIRTGEVIVEPTIICKPLKEGANYSEVFSPLIFVQEYENDRQLAKYFEHSHYARNAMYISLYGTSPYVRSLINRPMEGRILHDITTVLFDTHLHAPGIERGTQPYGGFGYNGSSYSIHGKVTCIPTLPQRDIFVNVVKPLLQKGAIEKRLKLERDMKKILVKDVQKLLGLKGVEIVGSKKKIGSGKSYVDALDIIASDSQRYIEFEPDRMFTLLDHVNVEHVAKMQPKHVHQIRSLRKYLKRRKNLNQDEIKHFLYSVAKKIDAPDAENKAEQLAFFKNVYQLLLAQDSGPRLNTFLMDADREHILALLDI